MIPKKRHILSESDKEYISIHFPDNPTADIAKHIGCSYCTVAAYASKNGLKKDPLFMQRIGREQMMKLDHGGRKHQFPKKHIPMNKGLKMSEYMSEEAIARTAATRFQKGHVPHNSKNFGKPFLYLNKKKGESTWLILVDGTRVSYLKHLCRQHGIDMEGKVARLKPGFDKSKLPTMDDVDIISFRENMQMNTLHRFPKEISKLIQLKGALNRQIRKHSKNQ